MSKRVVQVLSLILLLAMVLSALPAMAATNGKPRIIPRTTYVDPTTNYNLDLENVPSDAKVISCKSDKPYVVMVWGEGRSLENCHWEARRAGRAKITLKYKANGQTKTISGYITVKKLPRTLTSLKINDQDCAVKYFPHRYEEYYYTGNKVKIDFKVSTSWKVSYCVATLHNKDWSKTKEIRWKNGKSFNLPKDWSADLYIGLDDRNGGFFTYSIFINR